MTATYDVLTAAPDLVLLYLARQGARGPHAVRLGQITDGLLARVGVDQEQVPTARRVLIVHAVGSAAFATGGPTSGLDGAPAAARPISEDQAWDSFQVSLRWLLAGTARGASSAGGC